MEKSFKEKYQQLLDIVERIEISNRYLKNNFISLMTTVIVITMVIVGFGFIMMKDDIDELVFNLFYIMKHFLEVVFFISIMITGCHIAKEKDKIELWTNLYIKTEMDLCNMTLSSDLENNFLSIIGLEIKRNSILAMKRDYINLLLLKYVVVLFCVSLFYYIEWNIKENLTIMNFSYFIGLIIIPIFDLYIHSVVIDEKGEKKNA